MAKYASMEAIETLWKRTVEELTIVDNRITEEIDAVNETVEQVVQESIVDLEKAVEELQSKATNVKFTPTLTEGEEIGTLEIDDNSTTLYAPKYEDMTEQEIDEMMGLYGMDDENGDGVSDDFSAIIQEQVIRYFEEEVDLPLIVEEVIDDSLASDEDIENLK